MKSEGIKTPQPLPNAGQARLTIGQVCYEISFQSQSYRDALGFYTR